MKALITGGAGFIGSTLARNLAAAGHAVVILDDLSAGSLRATGKLPLVRGDVSSPETIDAIREIGPDVVVHAAAQVSVPRSLADPARDEAVNVDGTRNVVEGARLAGTTRLVFLSSGGAIYGDTAGADESAAVSPMSPYGANKLKAESIVAESGLSYAIARLANVYGAGQRSDLEGGVVAIFVEALSAGSPITIHGDGAQRRDFVHVDDVVGATSIMATTERSGTWNVGTGASASILELLRMLEDRFGKAASVTFAPRRPGDVRNSTLRIERITAELGWTPTLDLRREIGRLLNGESATARPPAGSTTSS